MQQSKYLNGLDSCKNCYIYKIIPLDRLFELFTKRKNVLVHPRKWFDPFEKFIGKIVPLNYENNFYGQCWTLQKASDAMWRIYSPERIYYPKWESVRIRTTAIKLIDSLNSNLDKRANVQIFIGKVRYLYKKRCAIFIKKS